MIPMRTFRADQHFTDLFAHVHVICLTLPWWQLNTLFRWCKRQGIPGVLCSVSAWGFITPRHAGDRQDPATYKPHPRTFRPLTDESLGSDLPFFAADLAAFEALRLVPILPRPGGGGSSHRRCESVGTLPSPLDSS